VKATKGTILIYRTSTGQKDYQVPAEIFGQLAVHRSIETNEAYTSRGMWIVAHIHTGGVAASAKTKTQAMAIAAELETLDWSKIKSARSIKALRAIAPLRAEILARHGAQ